MTIKKILKKLCHYSGIPPYFLRTQFFECKMAIIRLYGFFQRKKINNIQKKANIKLHFGCGETHYSEWVNIDSFFAKNVDVVLDLRRTLPFETASVHYCYSEHFLEHLYPEEGLRHLGEVYRVLQSGGIYRVVVPAGIRFVEKYLAKDAEFFKLAFPWEERPMDAIYNILNWGGEHKNIFDFSQLEYLGKKAGFSEIRECTVNGSVISVLRIDKKNAQRAAESLYVEFI